MSEAKYTLIYPFKSREHAFEVANDIDGSLMWQNGTAYPIDNRPAFIIPASEFSSRWTAPREREQLQAKIDRLNTLLDVADCPQCRDKSGAYYDNNGEVCQCQWCCEVAELNKGDL